jgi:hypothetical protein
VPPYRLSTVLGCVRLAKEALRGCWLGRLSANRCFTHHAALRVVLYDGFAAPGDHAGGGHVKDGSHALERPADRFRPEHRELEPAAGWPIFSVRAAAKLCGEKPTGSRARGRDDRQLGRSFAAEPCPVRQTRERA